MLKKLKSNDQKVTKITLKYTTDMVNYNFIGVNLLMFSNCFAIKSNTYVLKYLQMYLIQGTSILMFKNPAFDMISIFLQGLFL